MLTGVVIRQDLDQTAQFLHSLDPGATALTFQKYPDHVGCTERPQVLHGSFDKCRPLLAQANRDGCAIAVTINATDGKGRSNENIVKVRALALDGDNVSLDQLRNCGVAPHAVNETSPGHYHAYWLTADCPLHLFSQLQEALAIRFGCPDSVKDLAHTMRLPGFLHQKDPARPFLSRIVPGIGDPNHPPYTVAEIIQGLGLQPPPSKPVAAAANDVDKSTSRREWLRNIRAGENLHESTLRLAGSLVATGMAPGAVVGHIRDLLEESDAPRDDRFRQRWNDIPRLVRDAQSGGFALTGDRPSAEHARQAAAGLIAAVEAIAATSPQTQQAEQPRPPFELVPILGDIERSKPTWLWQGRIPKKHVTLFSGHGESGKTMIMLQASICSSLGLPLFGIPTTQCNVVFFSAEDGGDLLRYRVHYLCRRMGVDPAQLEGKLFILDASTNGDPALYLEVTEGGRKIGVTSQTYDRLREFMQGKDIGLLVIDNSSDVFDANEIERAKVRAFMRSLASLAREFDAAVVLLAHIDKRSARGEAGGTDSYSGSTAWHNSARSRLFLRKQSNHGLVLAHEKCNLAPRQGDLLLQWPEDGIPTATDPGLLMQAQTTASRVNLIGLLRLIYEHTEQGKYITPSNNSRCAAAVVLKGKDGYPAALDSVGVEQLLKEALADGYLQIDLHKSADGHRNGAKHWALTPAGIELAGIQTAEVGSGK